MKTWELIVLAIGLAMDAFAVSVSKGISVGCLKKRHSLITGAWFGIFQTLMPAIGCFVTLKIGEKFEKYIIDYDHWIAFALLSIIGANMLREAIFGGDDDDLCDSFTAKAMFPLAIATSIDALAAGFTLAVPGTNIVVALILIGVVTFVLSAIGVKLGNIFGSRFKTPAEIAGGAVLILLGVKILLEHLGVL